MRDTVILLHGWSGSGDKFSELADFLRTEVGYSSNDIHYFNYDSLDDSIQLADIAGEFYDFIFVNGLHNTKITLICHSTGALIVREAFAEYFARQGTQECIERIIMLAPVNFGSPFAHWGKSVFGRLFKGRRSESQMLEVGERLLAELEPSSPYLWELAERDCLDESENIYNNIPIYILVGGSDLYGITDNVLQKPGTDGVISICGADMNPIAYYYQPVDTSDPDMAGCPPWIDNYPLYQTCFGVVPNTHHLNIYKPLSNPYVSGFLTEIFNVTTDEGFEYLRNRYQVSNKKLANRFSQMFLMVRKDGIFIRDYIVDFYILDKNGESNPVLQLVSGFFNRFMTLDVHSFSKNTAYKRFAVNMEFVCYIKTLVLLIFRNCKMFMRIKTDSLEEIMDISDIIVNENRNKTLMLELNL